MRVKSFLSSTLLLGTIALSPTIKTQEAEAAPSFNCGPNMRTYVVKSLKNDQGKGIRCVKFGNSSGGFPKIAWYGEGNWNGKTYRHVGHALGNGVGYASDIYGNGEDFRGNFNGNLKFQFIGTTIKVTGAWNEEWTRVQNTNYTPLRKPSTCGRHFDQYKASDLKGSRRGSGLRCALRIGRKNTTWFGNGNWGGKTYSHVGTLSGAGYSAGDICQSSFGAYCNNSPYGTLKIQGVAGGFDVTGSWSEKWRR